MSFNDQSTRSGTPPPEYQVAVPRTASNQPVRPPRPAKSQTLEDIIDLYDQCVEKLVNSQLNSAKSLKPSLKLAVHQNHTSVSRPRASVAGVKAVSPVKSHCHIRSPDAQNSPDVILTPPPYQFLDKPHVQKAVLMQVSPLAVQLSPKATVSPRRQTRFQLPVTRKPMDKWACQYTYRACAFLAARKLASILRSPSAKLIALLKPAPFVWSDPAEPVLAWLRQFYGVTIYTSEKPCTVPHLVVTEPTLDDDGHGAWMNAAPPQNSVGGKLLTLTYRPPIINYQDIADEEWYTSEDMGSEFVDDLDFTFDDDFVLPSPDRAESDEPFTPPPSYDCADSPVLNMSLVYPKLEGALEQASIFSPTGGSRVPMYFVEGHSSSYPYDFPSPVELDTLLSPEGFNSWMAGRTVF